MGLAFNGQVYDGWYTPVYKDDKIDCGLNYDPSTDTTELTAPKTLFELATPGYYYTDTDFLRSIGLASLVDTIIGSTRNVQALIRSRDNYKYVSDLTVETLNVFYYWYLLAQTQFNKDILPSDLDTIYDKLHTEVSHFDQPFIIPQQKLKNLVFYDYNHEEIPLTTPALSTVPKGNVEYCSWVDPNNISSKYPISVYEREGISYDIYIGSYHVVVYEKILSPYYFYINDTGKEIRDAIINHNFFALAFSVDVTKSKTQGDSILEELGYNFVTSSSGTNISVSGVNPSTGDTNYTFICYGYNSGQGKSLNDSAVQNTRTTWFNADPTIYTKIGKLPDDTIGVLPKGADMNNVGVGSDKVTDLYYTGIKITDFSASTPDKLLFPLGTYYLDPNAKYSDYKNFPSQVSNCPVSITAYSLDGKNIMQEVDFVDHSTTYMRVGYAIGLGKTTWTNWSQSKWA